MTTRFVHDKLVYGLSGRVRIRLPTPPVIFPVGWGFWWLELGFQDGLERQGAGAGYSGAEVAGPEVHVAGPLLVVDEATVAPEVTEQLLRGYRVNDLDALFCGNAVEVVVCVEFGAVVDFFAGDIDPHQVGVLACGGAAGAGILTIQFHKVAGGELRAEALN